jgi:uncharacterized membrane protein
LVRIFLVCTIVFGLGLVFLIPPFQAPDEPGHFFRAYQISEGRWIARAENGVCGGELPASLVAVGKPFVRLEFKPRQKTSRAEIVQTMKIPLAARERKFVLFAQVIYPPVAYVPQAVAIGLGRELGISALGLMYLGRLANLLVFAGFGCVSLAIVPMFGRPLALILLMPMTLFLAASLSGDVVTDWLAMLLSAMVLRACCEPTRLGLWQLGAIALVSLGLALTKLAYFPLVGLVALIPAARFGGGRAKSIFLTGLFALTILAETAWIIGTAGLHAELHEIADPHKQATLLLRHPWNLLVLIWHFLVRDGWNMVRGFIGSRLGWMDTKLVDPIVTVYLLVLIASLWPRSADKAAPPPRGLGRIVLLCVGSTLGAVGLLNYIFWNPVGDRYIDGLQGRYLIPVAPATVMLAGWGLRRLISPAQWDRGSPGAWNWVLLAAGLGSGITTILSVYFRYYV